MSDVIRLLPDSVANQIAAGEVIQRPASVIKELVENSIDAGATSITIVLKDAGRTLIQVIDNGCGMTDTDARMAFERHATSKIQRAADLFTLSTMGFRGEALASIAAIAQVDLRTMRKDAQLGTRLIISGSVVESQEPEACVPGSNMMVKNLFFNVPARRKFLKKDTVELSAIMREFERLALVNTAVDFTLVSNDVTLHSLRRGPMKRRITELFGKNLDKQLIPIETETSLVSINGFIGLPANARKRNPLQYLMVNGRNMRHPYFHKAIMQCYERLIPADEQPNYFINLHVDPETIDVNIHPTKNEIKFENEQGIWQILTAAIRDSLGRYNVAPSIDFDVEDAPDIPTFNPDEDATHGFVVEVGYNPFNQPIDYNPAATADDSGFETPQFPPTPAGDGTVRRRSSLNASGSTASSSSAQQLRNAQRASGGSVNDWAKLYDDFMRRRDEGFADMAETVRSEASVQPLPDVDTDDEAALRPMGNVMQLKNSYILTPCRDGLMVIDQHRAHLCVLYAAYMRRAAERTFTSQSTMFPDTLELSPAQDTILTAIAPSLEELGFRLAPLGDHRWAVNALPSIVKDSSGTDILLHIIENVTDTGQDAASSLHEELALHMARSGAIKRGQPLSADEMDHLISELFLLPAPGITPEGKKVYATMPVTDIASLLQ